MEKLHIRTCLSALLALPSAAAASLVSPSSSAHTLPSAENAFSCIVDFSSLYGNYLWFAKNSPLSTYINIIYLSLYIKACVSTYIHLLFLLMLIRLLLSVLV